MTESYAIVTNDLTKNFGSVRAVSKLNLKIPFGKTYGLLGPNGAGIGSMMLGHLSFVDSKDVIWVYKRSPRGIKSLVYSYLYAMLILNVFITISITIIFSIFASLDLIKPRSPTT
ncbi:unnamed protein product [marine sediment metagenome]|uniref:ABC transporter domain-containing protein n=1 Tax=marine sediment metagenome TaxID=412755 RepID=X1BUF3_9ZZZZ